MELNTLTERIWIKYQCGFLVCFPVWSSQAPFKARSLYYKFPVYIPSGSWKLLLFHSELCLSIYWWINKELIFNLMRAFVFLVGKINICITHNLDIPSMMFLKNWQWIETLIYSVLCCNWIIETDHSKMQTLSPNSEEAIKYHVKQLRNRNTLMGMCWNKKMYAGTKKISRWQLRTPKGCSQMAHLQRLPAAPARPVQTDTSGQQSWASPKAERKLKSIS